MAKVFSCGDVVQGCQAKFTGESETQILEQVGRHARDDHGMTEVPAEVVAQVRASIHDE